MEFLLQKRADDKDSFPGCWDAASTGHIDAGEDAISAAIRELREELGIRARPSEFVLLFRRKVSEDNIFHGKRFLNNELKWVFLYKGALADTSIHFEEEEISGVEWQNAVSIRKALEKKILHRSAGIPRGADLRRGYPAIRKEITTCRLSTQSILRR